MARLTNLELKVPPVIVFLVSVFLVWLINWLSFGFSLGNYSYVAKTFYCIGALSGFLGMVSFYKMKTTVDPSEPQKASKLVTFGVYRFTRNPMYLGMLIILIGWAIRLGNPLGIIGIVLFIWYMNTYQIKPEERVLEEKFGMDYKNYKLRTRRWI